MTIPKVIFKFDKEKDLYNIWETCNKSSSWYDHKKNVSPDLLEICENKKFNECKKNIKKRRESMHNSDYIKIFTKSIQDAWNKINDEYFRRLGKIMNKPICADKFIAYITTMTRCPYNLKEFSFMVSFFRSISESLKTPCHEIMHFQFHKFYWEKVEKELGNEKTAHLKEALTALLNSDFEDLYFFEESGYDIHKELRTFIAEEWKKKQDFKILLNKCVEYMKK